MRTTKDDVVTMPDTQLNPDALEAASEAIRAGDYHGVPDDEIDDMAAYLAVSAYLAAALPEVTSVDPRELNRRGWTCGCEPGNYDTCEECQSACNELAGFLNRPEVKP